MPENPPAPSSAASTPSSAPVPAGGTPTRPASGSPPVTPAPTAAVTVFRLAALFTFLAVAMGSVVCATDSGAACPTWPGCHTGQIAPQWELSPLIEFTHRVVAMLTGPLVLAAAVLSVRLRGGDRWVRILPWVALAGAIAAGVFGRLVVVGNLPTWLGAVDLFSALTAMTVMTVAAVRVGLPAPAPDAGRPAGDHASNGTRRGARAAASSVVVLVAMHVTGIFAAGQGSFTRCVGWPVWRLVDGDVRPVLQGVRLGLASLAVAVVVTTAVMAVRGERFRRLGLIVAALFTAEMVLGVVLSSRGLVSGVAAAYSVIAVALLWCLGVLATLAGSAREVTRAEPVPGTPQGRELPQPVSL